jgi:putative heme-binding domain-containing protein
VGETTLGQRVYLAQECDLCHAINGAGGTVGPDLSHVGSKHDRAWLREEVIDPESHHANTQMLAQTLPKKQLDALADYLEGLK